MHILRQSILAAAIGTAMALSVHAPATAQEAGKVYQVAFITPSFDISDAWERVYHAVQARLTELGVEYEAQLLSMERHNDHATQLAQVEAVVGDAGSRVRGSIAQVEREISALLEHDRFFGGRLEDQRQ